MTNSHTKRTTPSASRNITGIVDTYASPAMGSLPLEYSRRSYDPVLDRGRYTNTSTSSSLSPSPSPYPLSDSRRAYLHQHQPNSTHSGYLDRAQLFGRTPIQHQHNARRTRPPSTSNERNIRKRSSRTPTGEWAEAGLPEPPIEASRVSAENAEGLVCTPSGITTLGVGEDTLGRFSPTAQSPAEDALREQFEKGRVELARNLSRRSSSDRKSKWAGRSFGKHREGCVSPKTPTNVSDGEEEEVEEEEFGYVDPASVRDVLARVKAREATGRTQSSFDGMNRGKNEQEPRGSYFNVDVPRRIKTPLFTGSADADKALPKLPDRRVRLLVEPPSMKTPSRRKCPSTAGDRTELSFSPIIAAIDVAPQLAGQDFTVTSAPIHLSLSAIRTTVSQQPTPPPIYTGLTFSQAIAIIYGCMAITASHQALLGLGGDIAAMDLIIGLFGAFLLGLAICVVLKMLLGARLRRVPGDVLR